MSQPQTQAPVKPPVAGTSLQDQLLQRQLEIADFELQTKRREQDEWQVVQENRARLAREQALETARKLADQLNKERGCSHLDEHNRNATRGNRGANGKLTIICQKCQKTWYEREDGQIYGLSTDQDKVLPSHLYPRQGQSGGFAGLG